MRYFNTLGANESTLIGDDSYGIPNDLTPYIARVASGGLPHLNTYGDDHVTRNGANERGYIHVMYLLNVFQRVIGKDLKKVVIQQHSGGLLCLYVGVELLSIQLNRSAFRSVEVVWRDIWKVQKANNFQ